MLHNFLLFCIWFELFSLVKLFFSFWYTYCYVLYIYILYKKKLCDEHWSYMYRWWFVFLLCSSKLIALFLMFASSFLFHMVCRSLQGVSNETPRCCRTSILAFRPSSMSLVLLLHIWMGEEKAMSIIHLFYSLPSEEKWSESGRNTSISCFLSLFLYFVCC